MAEVKSGTARKRFGYRVKFGVLPIHEANGYALWWMKLSSKQLSPHRDRGYEGADK